MVPYLADIRSLAFALATRVVIELHESEPRWAWTNLLALTRLVTQWRPQPVEVEYMARAGSVTTAFNATWEALQWDGWTDAQLAQLQAEWEGAEFLSGLQETAGLSCASMVAVCRFERGQPNSPRTPLRQIGTDLMRSPPMAWSELVQPMRESRYRKYGTYEDEKELMLVFSERERELSAALKKSSWAEMRAMPGITNASAFEGAPASRMRGRVRGAFPMYQNGPGLVARLAEAESRRRVVMTALALQRFRSQQGGFPDTLAELSPQWVKHAPADFSDARGLRYRKDAAGGFALYSIGLDCIDQGGRMAPLDPGAAVAGPFARPLAPDLVWPRVASREEIEEQRRDLELARKGAGQVTPEDMAMFRKRYGVDAAGETNAVRSLSIPPARVRAR